MLKRVGQARYRATLLVCDLSTLRALRSILIYRFLSQIVDSLLRESRHAGIPDTVLLPEGIPPSCQHRENVHTVPGSPNSLPLLSLSFRAFTRFFFNELIPIISCNIISIQVVIMILERRKKNLESREIRILEINFLFNRNEEKFELDIRARTMDGTRHRVE